MGLTDTLAHGVRSIFSRRQTSDYRDYGPTSSIPLGSRDFSFTTERNLVASIHTRIAVDVSCAEVVHAIVDENKNFVTEVKSALNECLRLTPNIDQTGRELIREAVFTMFYDGVVAIVPVDCDVNVDLGSVYNVYELRIGRVIQYYPKHVKVRIYDDNDGVVKDLVLDKRMVALAENPLYQTMNAPNSTLRRLLAKIQKLDTQNDASNLNRLNAFIQLQENLRSDLHRDRAARHITYIEEQLNRSPYGIAYIGAGDKVIPLNRSAENKLFEEVKDLKAELYSQLGITKDVFDGTADEKAMINYRNRTVIPVLKALTESMTRTFLTKTARTKGEWIIYRQNAFELLTPGEMAEVADRFTRNEILTSNDVRSIVGFRPSDDPKANELRNKNIAQTDQYGYTESPVGEDDPGAPSLLDYPIPK